jgi:hypothetical protein
VFEFTVGGRRSDISDVFPGFEERDRLGLVVRRPCGAVGASALILATVTAFYDIQRAKGEEFFVYPDYFLFHVGGSFGNHKMLDIFPAHKEVVVEDDPEEILQAINDRSVTRLLVEDVEPGDPAFERPTLASNRILTALAYSPRGRVRDADVEVSGNARTEAYVYAVLEQSEEVDQGVRDGVWARRKGLFEDGVPLETYRRLGIEEALSMLGSPALRHRPR